MVLLKWLPIQKLKRGVLTKGFNKWLHIQEDRPSLRTQDDQKWLHTHHTTHHIQEVHHRVLVTHLLKVALHILQPSRCSVMILIFLT